VTSASRKELVALRARVGLVFQDPDDQLFMPTVREDVAFGPLNAGVPREEVDERVREALRAVGMEHAIDRQPHALSMGERRRVAIATVLSSDPQLLVLDEPSANLDPRARRELTDVLRSFDRTMLLVTHDLPLAAELTDRSIVLDGGRAVHDGPTPDLLREPDTLASHGLELPLGFDADALVSAA
jgi:cobalt/nickel transport system ATP-binding protein